VWRKTRHHLQARMRLEVKESGTRVFTFRADFLPGRPINQHLLRGQEHAIFLQRQKSLHDRFTRIY
jgi:hypothetical protein